MEPRVVIKTHAGVSHPGIFSLVIERCSYPDRSSDERIVAKRLFEMFAGEGKAFKLEAKFAVIMARRFRFLRPNMTWDWRGRAVHSVLKHVDKSDSGTLAAFHDLGPAEKALYLKYYLEADGAIMVLLARELNRAGVLSANALGTRIHETFREIYGKYLDLSRDFRGRAGLRERLKKIQRERYDQTEVHHKVLPHLVPLVHLGILARREEGGDTLFYPCVRGDGVKSTAAIEDELVDIEKMEMRFAHGEYFTIIAQLAGPEKVTRYDPSQAGLVAAIIFEGYSNIREGITGTAHIDAICDWASAVLLAENGILLERGGVEDFLENAWKTRPSAVRYHIDFRGHRSYVILTEDFLKLT